MSATTTAQVKVVPRPLIRTFWAMHKALYRLSGGRIGLQRPERGAKFGMLRLHTTGRQSGKQRIAMIGYFEDGANLVTLAMNGWGAAEPAWWLNLQAAPTATVDTAGGTRTVRARAAVGEERDRLWATFAEFPGWGADLGGLAEQRPTETSIVVLEPVAASETAGQESMTDALVATARPAADDRSEQRSSGRRLRPRHLWILPGFVLAILGNELGKAHGVGILALIAFGIGPDAPRLLRYLGRGSASLSMPLSNLLHQPLVALAALAVASAGAANDLLPMPFVVASLVWVSHIVVGWGVGDGIRHRDGAR